MTVSQTTAVPVESGTAALSFKRSRNLKEQVIGVVLFLCAAVSTMVTVGIVAVLLRETLGLFSALCSVFLEIMALRMASPAFSLSQSSMHRFITTCQDSLIATISGFIVFMHFPSYEPS